MGTDILPGRFTTGNAVRLLPGGEGLWNELTSAIEGARHRVWLETFIFEADETGRHIMKLLVDAARRGCDVLLLFDHLGSFSFSLGFFKPITDAGGEIAIFNPLPAWRKWGRRIGPVFRYRDHRKIFIVDDIAFCGGHNISSDYIARAPEKFYGISIKLEGPCVEDVAAILLDTYALIKNNDRSPECHSITRSGSASIGAYSYDGRRDKRILDQAIDKALHHATKSCYLIVAYFVPDAWLHDLLIRTAKRNVAIKNLTAGRIDLPFMRWAGQHTYDELLEAGIEIFRMQSDELHSKCITVDDGLSFVGSYDVNVYERRQNLEVGIAVADRDLVSDLIAEFDQAMGQSQPITLAQRNGRSKIGRTIERLSYRLLSM